MSWIKKPWEESWAWDEEREGIFADTADEYGERCKIVETDSQVYPPRGLDRSLICAAPDMARVLLAIEWSGRQDFVGDGGYDCCPSCQGVAHDDAGCPDARDEIASGKNIVGHKPTCPLDAALRKAGVR